MRIVIAIAVLLALAGVSGAQSKKAAKTAEEAFEKGRKLMEQKSYDEACAAFELSQRLDPQYGTQFNLAGCYAAQDKVATAWKLYRELSRSDNNEKRRARSTELAKQLAKKVPKLRIRVAQQGDGLKVVVGALDVTSLLGADIPFDLGRYPVEATLPGHRPFREEIDIEAPGKVRELEITFERESGSGDAGKGGSTAGKGGSDAGKGGGDAGKGGGTAGGGGGAGEPADRPPSPERARYGKIAMAGGGGMLAFGLIAGWRALANRNASRDLCNAVLCPDREGAEAKIARARLWGNLSTVSVIVGAVGVAGGVYLWRTSRGRPATARIAPAVGPSAVSLVLSGAF